MVVNSNATLKYTRRNTITMSTWSWESKKKKREEANLVVRFYYCFFTEPSSHIR